MGTGQTRLECLLDPDMGRCRPREGIWSFGLRQGSSVSLDSVLGFWGNTGLAGLSPQVERGTLKPYLAAPLPPQRLDMM